MTQVAEVNHDVQMADFIESEFLSEQVKIFSFYCLPILENWFHDNLYIVSRLSHEHLGCFVSQVDAIKKISEYVAQLRRVGKGHGMIQFSFFIY